MFKILFPIISTILLFVQTTQAFDFSESYFIRRQAELAGIVMEPQTFQAGEVYTYSEWYMGRQHRFVTIMDVENRTVHYVEKIYRDDIDNIEGWVDAESGQLTKVIVNGEERTVRMRKAVPLTVVGAKETVGSPIGEVEAVRINFISSPGTVVTKNEDVLISPIVPGSGLIRHKATTLSGDFSSKWLEYSK